MSAFQVTGKTVTFTAATSAPTTVQAPTLENERAPQYVLTNIGTADVFVGYAADTGSATANAVIPTGTPTFGFWLLARCQVTLSGPPGAFFTGITASGTSIVYVTPGYGD